MHGTLAHQHPLPPPPPHLHHCRVVFCSLRMMAVPTGSELLLYMTWYFAGWQLNRRSNSSGCHTHVVGVAEPSLHPAVLTRPLVLQPRRRRHQQQRQQEQTAGVVLMGKRVIADHSVLTSQGRRGKTALARQRARENQGSCKLQRSTTAAAGGMASLLLEMPPLQRAQ
jgi:hypothetical protein